MTKQLSIDEMLDVLEEIGHPAFSVLKSMVESIADQCASAISESLNVRCGKAQFEGTAFAGTCVPFWAGFPGQPCPEPMLFHDETEWSDEDGNDLDPRTGKRV